MRKGNVEHAQQHKVARIATVSSAVVAMLVALLVQNQNVAFLATLAIAVAASANLPALLFTMYARRATAAGVMWGMIAGLVTAVGMILVSPIFLLEDALIPLKSPGLVSIPASFLLGFIGSMTERRLEDPVKQSEMEVRSLTGIGAEKPVAH